MQIDVLSGNTLKLTLNKFDMTDMGIKYETLSKKSEKTRRLLTRVLDAVKLNASVDCNIRFDFTGERLFVEAFPRSDGGCMLYISCINSTASAGETGGNDDMTLCRLPAAVCDDGMFGDVTSDGIDDTKEYNRKSRSRGGSRIGETAPGAVFAEMPSSNTGGAYALPPPQSPQSPQYAEGVSPHTTSRAEQMTFIAPTMRCVTGALKQLAASALYDPASAELYRDDKGGCRLIFRTAYADEAAFALCEYGIVVRGICEVARTREHCLLVVGKQFPVFEFQH